MDRALEEHEALKHIGEIMFFHHEGYATNIRGTEEFKLIEKYINEIESQNEELKKGNMYYQELPVQLAEQLNIYKKILNKACSLLGVTSKELACPNFLDFDCDGIKCEECKYNKMNPDLWKEYLMGDAQNEVEEEVQYE